jgi:hypothetical protein
VSELATTKNARAVRYRRLALAQQNKTIADLLLKLADECDRGARPNGDWRGHPAKMSSRHKQEMPSSGLSESDDGHGGEE